MNHLFKPFSILSFSILLSSCGNLNSITNKSDSIIPSHSSSSITASVPTNHEYSEVNSLKIFWSQIFLVDGTNYYIYFYSTTCSHCARIKNRVIEYALDNPPVALYFIEASSSVVISESKANNTNVDNLDDLGIRGYPTLLYLENKAVVRHLTGSSPILEELNSY